MSSYCYASVKLDYRAKEFLPDTQGCQETPVPSPSTPNTGPRSADWPGAVRMPATTVHCPTTSRFLVPKEEYVSNDNTLGDLMAARQAAEGGIGRALREAVPLSLTEVAAFLGVAPITLSRWERGLAVPRGAKAARYGQFIRSCACEVMV